MREVIVIALAVLYDSMRWLSEHSGQLVERSAHIAERVAQPGGDRLEVSPVPYESLGFVEEPSDLVGREGVGHGEAAAEALDVGGGEPTPWHDGVPYTCSVSVSHPRRRMVDMEPRICPVCGERIVAHTRTSARGERTEVGVCACPTVLRLSRTGQRWPSADHPALA
jgi:hypothetical protein